MAYIAQYFDTDYVILGKKWGFSWGTREPCPVPYAPQTPLTLLTVPVMIEYNFVLFRVLYSSYPIFGFSIVLLSVTVFAMQRKIIQILSISLFVAFLTWGVYTLVVYFGIPIHGKVLLNPEGWNYVAGVCDNESYFCRGAAAFFPIISHTLSRGSHFLWYLILSGVFYGIFLAWSALKHGNIEFRLTMKPWHILGIFLVCLWLLFTILTSVDIQQGNEKTSFRRIIEPHESVYTGDNQEGLTALQENFNRLKDRRCLQKQGEVKPGVGVYKLTGTCVQTFFITRVLSQVLFLLLLCFTFLVSGRAILSKFRIRPDTFLWEGTLSLGVGICAAIVFLWILAIFGILNIYLGWVAIIAVLVIGLKHTRYWLKVFLYHSWDIRRPWYSFMVICAWFLISYLAFNFLTVVRPFPIGWDDLGSYLNRPRLMVSYGQFIYKMAPFQWEYLSSLGYLLFGYNSVFGSTASMLVNWMAGLFAVLAIMTFVSLFLGRGTGVIAGLVYYTLPLVGHFSFADMKTDNAVFALQALSVLCLFVYLFPIGKSEDEEEKPRSWHWLALSGMFCAFAFGTKVTAIMVFMTLGAILFGAMLHWSAAIGVILISFSIFARGPLKIQEVITRVGWDSFLTPAGFKISFIVAGVALLLLAAFLRPKSIAKTIKAGAIVIVAFFVSIAPWVLHNNFQEGNIVPRLMLDAPNYLSPIIDVKGTYVSNNDKLVVRKLPAELAIDPTHEACTPTGGEEELGRYWGFREGWGHYLKLPWRTVMNLDSVGYYVTTSPALLLFPLLLLLPFFWFTKAKWLRWLFIGTIFLLLQWMFMANGVPWYGIGVFLGFAVGLEVLFVRAPDTLNRFIFTLLLSSAFISCFAMRFWQFEQQKNLIEFPMGKATSNVIRERTIPHYNNITDIALSRNKNIPDRPYVYRVGTFIPYFIPRNLEIIGANDHQLDTFSCLYQERDNALTLKRLKALGFNSIIFDTNTATIEKDQNGSLHKKVNSFVGFVNDASLGLQFVINDSKGGIVYMLIP